MIQGFTAAAVIYLLIYQMISVSALIRGSNYLVSRLRGTIKGCRTNLPIRKPTSSFALQLMSQESLSVISRLDADPLVKKISTTYTLSSGIKFHIHDYKTVAHRDEDYYSKTKSLDLRRGLSGVYSDDNKLVFLLAGLPKFGNQADSFSPPSAIACDERVYMMKENGEAGHFSFFHHENDWYAVIGSKNVHIVVSLHNCHEDLKYYESLNVKRLEYAIANAKLLLTQHENILKSSNIEFKQFMFTNTYTIVFEAVYNNHLVEYDSNKAIAFAITYPQSLHCGLSRRPIDTLELLSKQGFNVPLYEKVNFNDTSRIAYLDNYFEMLPNSEGAVVYEIGEAEVIKIYKHKNHLYVVQRMARELIKKRASYLMWTQRFADIHFDASYLENEIKQLLAFYVWVVQRSESKKILEAKPEDGVPWSDYIQTSFKDLLKEFKSSSSDDDVDRLSAKAAILLDGGAETKIKDPVILLVGIQGSGKTTLRNSLVRAIGSDLCTYVNQDELNGNRKAFISALKGSKGKLMIVDKCNHLYRLRDDVYSIYSTAHIVELRHPDGTNAMKALSLKRIKERGLSHPTLVYSVDTADILNQCSSTFEPVSSLEKKTNTFLSLSPLDTLKCNTDKVLKHLEAHGLKFNKHSKEDGTAEYEQQIMGKAFKNIKYWHAGAKNEDVMKILPRGVELHKIKKEFHMTMYYETKISIDRARELMASPNITVHVEAMVYNDKCAAMKITKSSLIAELCEREIPHITVGLQDGIPPVYANEMLADVKSKIIPMDHFLDLVIAPVLKK